MREESDRSDLGVVLFTVGLGYFMIQQALLPVSTILPTMAEYFQIDPVMAGWITNTYLLFLTGFLLIAGRLGDIYGHQVVFTWGVLLFIFASALNGFAINFSHILIWRALQGLASALVMANCFALVFSTFPDSKRGRAIGFVTMASSMGTVVGILLGSFFIHYLNWRWVFFAMIPMGIITFTGTRFFLPYPFKKGKRSVDFGGGTLIFLFLVTLTLSLSHPSHGSDIGIGNWYRGPWMFWLALVFFASLIIWEKHHKDALLMLAHFRKPQFSATLIGNGILHMTMIGPIYLIPFLVERNMGLSASYSAGLLLMFSLMNAVFSPISGSVYDRYRSSWLRPVAAAIISTGLIGWSLTVNIFGYISLVAFGFVVGIGLGFLLTPNNTVLMRAIPQEDRGFASGMLETTRQLGHSVAVTVSGIVLALGQTGTGLMIGHLTIEDYRRAFLTMALISLGGIAAAMVKPGQTAIATNLHYEKS